MNIDAYYQLKHDPQELPAALKLRYREWELLLRLNDERTVAQLGQQLGFEQEETRRILSVFLQKELIEPAEMNYGEYLKRKQSSGNLSIPVPAKPQPAVIEARPESRPVPVPPLPAAPQRESGFAPLPFPPAPKTETGGVKLRDRKLSMKSLIGFIMDQAGGDTNAGQLMVYRVFMRIDTKLLKRNGVNSLRFQEDRLIADPELENALQESVNRALGVPCPEDIFVAA